MWLKSLTNLGVKDFTVSDDEFHFENKDDNLSKVARSAADKLNIPTSSISINEPTVEMGNEDEHEKGKQIIGVNFKEQSLKVEPIKTALDGALECKFAVHLPKNVLNSNKLK